MITREIFWCKTGWTRIGLELHFPEAMWSREAFTKAVIREVWEETGLTIEHPRLCGLKQFPEEDGTRYIVMLYKANRFSGELRSSREGNVFWIKRSELENYPLAETFDQLIRVFEDDSLGEQYVHWDGDKFLREVF